MDSDFENSSGGFLEFSTHIHSIETCTLCQRALLPDSDVDDLDSIGICGNCKFILLEDLDATSLPGSLPASRTRHGSSDSIDSMFSQQFSQLINLARQNRLNSHEVAGPTSSRTTPTGSRRWMRAGLSDTESDGLDSLYGESELSFSFRRYSYSPYSEEDARSLSENETDIDPMNAGLLRWSSEDDDDSEWEVHIHGPPGSYGELLDEQVAEAEGSRRGAPPTSVSFVENLPRVVVEEDGAVCAICKDPFVVGGVANRLLCSHQFHRSCILPWLSTRNTCPLCRRELPTDDRDYETRRREREEAGPRNSDEAVGAEGGGGGGRRNRWWFVVAPIVGVLGITLMLCLGGKALGGRLPPPRSRENCRRRWWSLLTY